jgi:hypothetical protein
MVKRSSPRSLRQVQLVARCLGLSTKLLQDNESLDKSFVFYLSLLRVVLVTSVEDSMRRIVKFSLLALLLTLGIGAIELGLAQSAGATPPDPCAKCGTW